ncbi:TssQ family T6SS-associated lipoprotein [Noviherbaspirillum massiliense]|uniref:TssQ family T6SS-associated lipoprotein n=1 Tax=Noviherbaspirillum massiliense TaxID=1465823 RepID=UPI000307726C|nr:TssQ family T6SS-associated lipoprotein [Noviherbaspirillum massiliense]
MQDRTKNSLIILAAFSLAACSFLPSQPGNGQPALSATEVQTHYQQGLSNYRASRFDAALADLNAAVASGRLKSSEEINARKHMAFIHCVSNRELQCREQFQAILKSEPKFDLAANEAEHPMWGPVWRSVKGSAEERRAVSQASGFLASSAQNKLADGIKAYDDGRFQEALDTLQSALKLGLKAPADEIRARKYSAFIYCLDQKTRLCRGEFRKIFTLDPSFEMLPSEVGHPAWTPAYRREKAAAAKRAAKKAGKAG